MMSMKAGRRARVTASVLNMKLRHTYLIVAILGLIVPYSQFVPWVMTHGLHASLFFHEMFANRIAGFFVFDVLISAIAVIVFVLNEGPKSKLRYTWLPIVATLLVGVSLGLPLFLYLRQAQLDHAQG
jgi:hypothetical protein